MIAQTVQIITERGVLTGPPPVDCPPPLDWFDIVLLIALCVTFTWLLDNWRNLP